MTNFNRKKIRKYNQWCHSPNILSPTYQKVGKKVSLLNFLLTADTISQSKFIKLYQSEKLTNIMRSDIKWPSTGCYYSYVIIKLLICSLPFHKKCGVVWMETTPINNGGWRCHTAWHTAGGSTQLHTGKEEREEEMKRRRRWEGKIVLQGRRQEFTEMKDIIYVTFKHL